MASKNMKNLNPKTLKVFKDWIQFLPITWLKNLTPQKFSEQTGITLIDAEDFFDDLLDNNLAEAKINMHCPSCKDDITVNYKYLNMDFECNNCGHSFIPEKYCLNGDVLYRINKVDFNEIIQSRRIPQINRLIKNHPLDAGIHTKEKLIYLENMLEKRNETNSYNDVGKISEMSLQYNTRSKVFISYSHADRKFLNRLKIHLRQLEREDKIVYWEDTKIKTGQLWKEEIKKAIDSAKVAVLLISADFLASDFISDKELPLLLKAAKDEGTTILPVILSPCRFTKTYEIACFQAINSPDNTVIQMEKAKQEQMWVKLTEDIIDGLK